MVKKLMTGVGLGFLFGLVYAWADTLSVYSLARATMELTWDPFTDTTLRLVGLMLITCTVAGAILGPLGWKLWSRKPTYFIHAMLAVLVLVTWFNSEAVDQILAMGLAGVALSHGTSLILFKLYRWKKPLLGLMLPGMGAVWYVALTWGLMPALDHTLDPNRPKPAGEVPNILWVIFDTTRADHMSAYGYSRQTSPNFDKLASEGVLFERAYATAPWTVASHASMFTGLYSSQHWCHSENIYLDKTNTPIAQILADAGYDTSIYAGNPWLEDYTGLARGFGQVTPSWRDYTLGNLFVAGRFQIAIREWITGEGGQDKGARLTNESFERWLDKQQKNGRPFFGFVNYMEPHSPYHQIPYKDRDRFLPPGVTGEEADRVSRAYMDRMMLANNYQATPAERETAIAVYDGGIYNADTRLGDLVELLRKRNLLDKTLIIVAGDHGEMFGEHDMYGHEIQLYHPLVHVPLIMRWPGKIPAGLRIDKNVQLTDLFTTLLDVTGTQGKAPANNRGLSLMPVIAGGGDPGRSVYAEVFRTQMRPLRREVAKTGYDPDKYRMKSVQEGQWRLIRFPDQKEKLFEISSDPEENNDLKSTRPAEQGRLAASLNQFIKDNPHRGDAGGVGPAPEMDPAAKERLKALGYVQ